MYNKIIITGGTSVFGINNYIKEMAKDIYDLIKLKDSISVEEAIKKCRNRYYNLDSVYYSNVSAEFSVINELNKKGYLINNFSVSILHTDTFDGKIAAVINKKLIETYLGGEVKLIEVNSIDVSNHERLRNNLGDFMLKLSNELLYADRHYTFFAPVGGYKIMTYLAYMVGSFYGYDTGYLYETTQKLINIPPMPIEIDLDWILTRREIIKKMNDDVVEYSLLSKNEKEFIDDNSFFFEKVEDEKEILVTLNAFGKFILEGYLNTNIKVSKHIKDKLLIDNNYKNYIDTNILKLTSMVNTFYKNNGKSKDVIGTIMHNNEWGFSFPYLFKGKPNGQLIFRCLWDYDINEDVINIYEIWLDHDKYEHECNIIKEKGYRIEDVELIKVI